MAKWRLIGYNDRKEYVSGTKADCVRWLNSSYPIPKYGSADGRGLLPQPMLIVKYYPQGEEFENKRKPKHQIEWLDSELNILTHNLNTKPSDLHEQIPRHTVNAINSRLTIVRAEIRERLNACHNQQK